MSAESVWDVQTAIFSRLSSDENLTTLLADGVQGVRDHVPLNTSFPYLVIGETRCKPFDTVAEEGMENIFTIHCYSRESGMNETRQIMSAIYDSLHNADFSVPNQSLISCRLQQSETRLESDGKTRHGIQQFQIITEPV